MAFVVIFYQSRYNINAIELVSSMEEKHLGK